MTTRRPTGSDVARVAGVSKSAVSRAFTGGQVSEEARRRIMEAVRILKYRPNNTARSLITNRSLLVGLAITDLDNQYYPRMVMRLHAHLAAAGYRMVLFVTHGEADLDPVLDELLSYQLAGVILASSSHAARVGRECLEAGVPVVMLNNIDPEGRIPGISTDNAAGARAIAGHLLAAGHRRLGLITGLEESSASQERSQAFRAAVASHPEAHLLEACGHYSAEGATAATQALLGREDRVEALFCVTDAMAIHALHTMHAMGLVPGRDVAVFGFDDVPVASWPPYALATYSQPLEEMVKAAVTLLRTQIAGQPFDHGTLRLKGQLVLRESGGLPHHDPGDDR